MTLPSTPAPEWSGVASKTELTHLSLVKHKLTAWQLSSAPHCWLTQEFPFRKKQPIESSLSKSYGHKFTDFYYTLKYCRCRHKRLTSLPISFHTSKESLLIWPSVPCTVQKQFVGLFLNLAGALLPQRCALSLESRHTRRSILVKISLCVERFLFCTTERKQGRRRFCDPHCGVITFVVDFGPTGARPKRLPY